MSEGTQVIFGGGPLGIATMNALHKRGKRIRLVNRSGSRPTEAPPDIEVVAGDACNTDFTRQVTADAAVVYQCAQPEYHKWVTEFPALQAAILDGAATNGAKLIVGENLYMYGDTNGQPIHEGLPHAAHTRKGKVRAQMSEALLAAHRSGKVRVAMARGSDFYGPGVLGSTLGERTFVSALKGKPAEVTGALDQPHTYTYIQDFGEAMAILGEREQSLGQAWHVPNPPTLTHRQLLTIFFQLANRPARFTVMGTLMMRLGGIFIPEARETVEMMYEFTRPFVVDSSKFIKAFGDIATPHEAAMQATLAWYHKRMANHH
jgi:nucleoside-diphosphate-sugar epimerase